MCDIEIIRPSGKPSDELRRCKGLTWTFPKTCNGKCTYVHESDKLPNSRLISGARKYFTSDKIDNKDIIYIPELSICGIEDDIREALIAGGYTKNEAQSYIDIAITNDNYDEDEYKERLDKFCKTKSNMFDELCDKVFNMYQYIENKDNIVLLDNKKQQVGSLFGSKEDSNPLKLKYDQLQTGQILDVSGMDIDTLKNSRPKKFNPKNIKNLYYDSEHFVVSKNLETYEIAINELFPDDASTIITRAKKNVKDVTSEEKPKKQTKKDKAVKEDKNTSSDDMDDEDQTMDIEENPVPEVKKKRKVRKEDLTPEQYERLLKKKKEKQRKARE